jgi:hypothetical protein
MSGPLFDPGRIVATSALVAELEPTTGELAALSGACTATSVVRGAPACGYTAAVKDRHDRCRVHAARCKVCHHRRHRRRGVKFRCRRRVCSGQGRAELRTALPHRCCRAVGQ